MTSQYVDLPVLGGGASAGVSSLNGLTGIVSLVAGSNITLTTIGNAIQIAASGGGGGISGSWAATTGNIVTTNGASTAQDSLVALTSLAPKASPTFTGTVTTPALNISGQTASQPLVLDASKNAVSISASAFTATLSVMVGDSGSGGTKGLAPAPGAGDAAAGKFLKADATWAVPPSGIQGSWSSTTGNVVTTNGASTAKDSGTALSSLAPLGAPVFVDSITINKTVSGQAKLILDCSDRPTSATISLDWTTGALSLSAPDDEIFFMRQGTIVGRTTASGLGVGSGASGELSTGDGTSMFILNSFSGSFTRLIRSEGYFGFATDNSFNLGYDPTDGSLSLRPANIAVGSGVFIGTTSPASSALLQADSTTKGFLCPRMTTTQRTAITAAEGLEVYDLTTHKKYVWDGTTWQPLW